MLSDLETSGGGELTTQTCIIGAGAAGITLARRLLAAGHQVVLLESGGADYEKPTAALNAGESVGQTYYDLEHARLRFFGGTTAIWGGRCAELNPIDFTKRGWVPHSGWPLTYAELAPYYRAARTSLGLPETMPGVAALEAAQIALPPFAPERLETQIWAFDSRFNRFTLPHCADLRQHARCHIILHANVSELVPTPDGTSIDHLVVRSLNGHQLVVRAQTVVLAAGGIENPRLLLASRSVMPQGIGNRFDHVGRYFMEHPHARGGHMHSPKAWMLLNAYDCKHQVEGTRIQALLRPSETLQAARGLLNSSMTIAGRRPLHGHDSWGMSTYKRLKHSMNPTHRGRALWMRTKQAVNAACRLTDPLRPWLMHRLGRYDLALFVRAEQAPNPSSRVMLGTTCDALGMPRAVLDWRTSPLDIASVAGLVGALGEECQRLGLGDVVPAPWLADTTGPWQTDALLSTHPLGGYHHMGTTRMAARPEEGVTDDTGRVHGMNNLYVAGSSLFPTSGWANPTLTIIALAMRTADAIAAARQNPA
jgi:choline dehydrogenase-like flavoprotein